MPHLFDKEKYVIHYENLQLYLRQGLKLKKINRVSEFNQSQSKFNTHKRIEAEKNNDKDKKSLYDLMNDAMENVTMLKINMVTIQNYYSHTLIV